MPENENDIQKQIEARINELPADIQNAIFAVDFNDKIAAIGNSARLHIDQIQELNELTMSVMLGFMTEDEYREEVNSLVKEDANTSQKILHEVNEQVFLPIRQSMKDFAASQAAPAPVVSPAPAAVSSPASTRQPLSEVLPKPSTQSLEITPEPALPIATDTTLSTPTTPNNTVEIPKPEADLHPADVMLNEKTISTSASTKKLPDTPPKPENYKADPYREPIN